MLYSTLPGKCLVALVCSGGQTRGREVWPGVIRIEPSWGDSLGLAWDGTWPPPFAFACALQLPCGNQLLLAFSP